jgi:4-alpha-glucanotransferase
MWPKELKNHETKALKLFASEHLEQITLVQFEQFLFFNQWQELHRTASAEGVLLFGDIPIYVGHDSADVWGNQTCFDLDRQGDPVLVAGVPPDCFSETGQRWGNPLYKWQVKGKKNKPLYRWWQNRFKILRDMVDLVRIDHFRGFEAYWAIDNKEETAENGTWLKGPGLGFFKDMKASVGDLEIIAEDLGIITPEVEQLRDDCGFPGMKILQFAFGSGADNSYLPQNYTTTNTVVYGGTHDNDTAVGWFLSPETTKHTRDDFRRLANSDGSSAHLDFNRLALGSIAKLAIIPMQDVLGFGADCRMNTPGTIEDNWLWRCELSSFSKETATYLLKEITFYNRLPERSVNDTAEH